MLLYFALKTDEFLHLHPHAPVLHLGENRAVEWDMFFFWENWPVVRVVFH